MRKKQNEKSVDEYIAIAKADIFVYVFVSLLFLAGAGVIALMTEWYYGFGLYVLLLFVLPRVPEKIATYFRLKQLKQYIFDHNLQDSMGKIDFWNEKNCFLTEKYMIILFHKKILHFPYEDIEKMYEQKTFGRSSSFIQYHLHLVLKDKQEIEILIYTTFLVGEEVRDISKYLLDKNGAIKQ